jgi:hypothetical protein
MALIAIDWNPHDGRLRQFALGVGIVCLSLAAWLWWVEVLPAAVGALAALGIGVALFGLVWPDTVRYLYLTAMVSVYPMGWLVSHLLLAVIFYGVVTPFGLIVRLMGRDGLEPGSNAGSMNYWQPRKRSRS